MLLKNDSPFEGLAYGFGFGVDVEFLVNGTDVVSDGIDALIPRRSPMV